MKFENRVQRYQHLFTKTDKRIVNYIRQMVIAMPFQRLTP